MTDPRDPHPTREGSKHPADEFYRTWVNDSTAPYEDEIDTFRAGYDAALRERGWGPSGAVQRDAIVDIIDPGARELPRINLWLERVKNAEAKADAILALAAAPQPGPITVKGSPAKSDPLGVVSAFVLRMKGLKPESEALREFLFLLPAAQKALARARQETHHG